MKKLLTLFGILAVVGCSFNAGFHDVVLQVSGTGNVSNANVVYEHGTMEWRGGQQTLPWSLNFSMQHGPVSLSAAPAGPASPPLAGSLAITIVVDGVLWQTQTIAVPGMQQTAMVSGIL